MEFGNFKKTEKTNWGPMFKKFWSSMLVQWLRLFALNVGGQLMKTARNTLLLDGKVGDSAWAGGWRVGVSPVFKLYSLHVSLLLLCSILLVSKLLETILTISLCQQACQSQIEPPARRDSHLDPSPREPSFRP